MNEFMPWNETDTDAPRSRRRSKSSRAFHGRRWARGRGTGPARPRGARCRASSATDRRPPKKDGGASSSIENKMDENVERGVGCCWRTLGPPLSFCVSCNAWRRHLISSVGHSVSDEKKAAKKPAVALDSGLSSSTLYGRRRGKATCQQMTPAPKGGGAVVVERLESWRG